MIRDNSLLVLATVVLVTVAIAVITRVRRSVHERDADREEDLLTDLQKAYIKGQMDEAEFRRIQDSLGKRKQPPSPGGAELKAEAATSEPNPAEKPPPPIAE